MRGVISGGSAPYRTVGTDAARFGSRLGKGEVGASYQWVMSWAFTIGLERGADDDICKPLGPRELVARVQVVPRRDCGHKAEVRLG